MDAEEIVFTGFFKTLEDDDAIQESLVKVHCHIDDTAPEDFVAVFNALKDKSICDDYESLVKEDIYDDGYFFDGDYYHNASGLIYDYPELFTIDSAEAEGENNVDVSAVSMDDLSHVVFFYF